MPGSAVVLGDQSAAAVAHVQQAGTCTRTGGASASLSKLGGSTFSVCLLPVTAGQYSSVEKAVWCVLGRYSMRVA